MMLPNCCSRPGRAGVFTVIVIFVLLVTPGPARAQMPIFGDYFAHDPSTMIKEGNRYYIFYTGFAIPYKWSTDLRNWTWNTSQRVFPSGPPAWVTNAVPGFDQNYWAPDVAYFNGKYHVYYSVSRWGTIDSAIGLVTSPSLISPAWTDQGKVVQSDASWEAVPETDTTSFNCIDPAILQDTNGTIWMVYGSYSDGILVTQIDPTTGKRLNPASIGTRIANNGPNFFSNTTEAAHIHQRGGYYWLFLNFGGCCSGVNSTYNIRVGRSLNVTGPYLDKNNVNMLAGGGTMLLESTGRFIGPGHAGIFVENETNWFTYHYYDALNSAEAGRATLGLTQLHWAADGWPALTNDWSALYTFNVDAREHCALYNGTLQSGASIVNEPGRGRVLQLNGTTNFVRLTDPVANAKSFAAWVKWNGGGDWQRIFDFGSNTTKYAFLTPRANTRVMRFAIRNGGAEQMINAPAALPTNSWVHVAVTLDGQRGILYQNGLPIATNLSVTIRPWQMLARSNYLGKSQFAADPNFNGRIDSFRVFSRALSAAEVRDIAGVHPDLAHRYSFSSNVWDSVGMAHGTLKGNASVTNAALKLTGAAGGYVDLPGGLVSGSSAVTAEFWASFGVSGNWARVFDFGNISGNNGQNFLFFSPRTAANGLRLGLSTSGGTADFDPPGTFDNQTLHVVTITDPIGGYSAVYTNGVLRAQLVAALPPLTGVSPNWSFIGRSLFSADGWLNATIDEFRLYDGRLTPDEIQQSYEFGPDVVAIPISLSASNAVANYTLWWPAYAAGYTLESSLALGASALWTPVSQPALLADNHYWVTLPRTNTAQFFRLRR